LRSRAAIAVVAAAATAIGTGCAEPQRVPLTARAPTPLPGPAPAVGILAGADVTPILRARAPISIGRVLDLAADKPNIVRFAKRKLAESDADLHEREAEALLPTIRILNEFQVHDGPIQVQQSPSFASTGKRDFLGLRVLKDWNIFGAYEELTARSLDRDADRENLGSVQLTSLEDGAEGYFDLQQAQAGVAIAREALARANEFLTVAGALEREKLGLTVDRLQAESEVARRNERSIAAEETFRVASATLATFLRLDPTVLLYSDEAAVHPITFIPPQTDVDVLIKSAYATRPDIREQRDRVQSREHQLSGAAISPFVPHVVLGLAGNDGGLGFEFPGASLGDPHFRADYYVGLEWEIVGGGVADYFHAQRDKAQLGTAMVAENDRNEHVARQIIEAHQAVRSRWLAIEAARREVAATEEAWTIALQRLRQGLGIAAEVLAANEARTLATTRLVDAISHYNKNQFKLLARMGERPDLRDFGAVPASEH
jgi:outer membrane protein TolC